MKTEPEDMKINITKKGTSKLNKAKNFSFRRNTDLLDFGWLAVLYISVIPKSSLIFLLIVFK
jgi:hypothetical protein